MLRYLAFAFLMASCGTLKADIIYSFTAREGGGSLLTASGNGELDGMSTVQSGSFPTSSAVMLFKPGQGGFEIGLSDVQGGNDRYLTTFNLLEGHGVAIPPAAGAGFSFSNGTLVDLGLNPIRGINTTFSGAGPVQGLFVYSDTPPPTSLVLNTGFTVESNQGDFSAITPGTIIFENPNGSVGRNRIIFRIGAVPEPSTAGLVALACAGLVLQRRRR